MRTSNRLLETVVPRCLASFLVLSVSGHGLAAEPVVAPEAERLWTNLESGRLYTPRHLTPRDGRVDLIVHFHGGQRIMADVVDTHRINAAVVTVHYGGLSSAYRVPFEDHERFSRLLNETEEHLALPMHPDEPLKVGRINLVSFSAGYGAVREILKSPEYVERIDGVLLTDSMYAGYARDAAGNKTRQVEPAHVSPYVAFAERAVAEEKTFVVTHSYLPPGGYAGTHECAAALAEMLSLAYAPVAEEDATATETETGEMELVERVGAGGLHVLGYAGETGDDHGDHLRHTAAWLPMLPLEFLPPPQDEASEATTR